jgi:hypothetical protein
MLQQNFSFPCSLNYPNYPEEKYNELINKFKLIKTNKMTNDDKWNCKYELIKQFINDTKLLPYWSLTKYIGNIDSIKNEHLKQYRITKMNDILCCNYIKKDGTKCINRNRISYETKIDPFKCHQHIKMCPNCVDWIDSQSCNKKYDNYCARCFKQLFPNDKRSKIARKHDKELIVRNFINDNFEGFIHDTVLYTGNCECVHRRRIDHRKLIENTLLCIETDEYGHNSYNKHDEIIRYDDLFMIFSGKWIFIRFNPDKKGISMDEKLNCLYKEIVTQITRIQNNENNELIEIYKLFY